MNRMTKHELSIVKRRLNKRAGLNIACVGRKACFRTKYESDRWSEKHVEFITNHIS